MSPLELVFVTVVLVVFYWSSSRWPSTARPLTVGVPRPSAASAPGLVDPFGPLLASRTRSVGPPRSSRQARAANYRDPLAPYRAVVGLETRTPWYIRVRAAMLLLLIVATIGAAIATVTLVAIASGRFLLESLAG